MPIDDSYTAPNAFPSLAVGNLTIAGSTTNISSATSTTAGSQVRQGGETVQGGFYSSGGATIGGSGATVIGAAFNGATITGANTGTLTNSPHAGNPFTFLEITVNGTTGCIPVFAPS